MIDFISDFCRLIINAVLPPRCIKCGKILSERNSLCAECFNKIRFIGAPMCACCGRPFDNEMAQEAGKKQICGACLAQKRPLFALKRFAFIYDDDSKNLILGFKFADKTSYATVLGDMLWRAGRDIWDDEPDLIIPVPIHRQRLLERRYNQSALLARHLAKKTNIDADYFSLQRVRYTIPQVQLSGAARRNNLKQAFAVIKPQNIKGRKIVLIDDVETTGSTLAECAKVLKKAGAQKVYALTLARPEY